jgi:hypothetical protein
MENDISHNGKPSYEVKHPEIPWNTSMGMGVGKDKLGALSKSVDEINLMINERLTLSQQIYREAEKAKMEITNFLLETKAVDSEGFKERNGLRQKQIDLSELQLKEKMSCWQDIALLKRELREKEKELTEKKDRADMLDKILEE